ncbi:hypothetical protein [Mycobacterium lepromatosis]|uniref:hypothetical protein n=1 Tax=Mycobacterium lepromatosis TaxID=480418 RepID=UPI001F239099
MLLDSKSRAIGMCTHYAKRGVCPDALTHTPSNQITSVDSELSTRLVRPTLDLAEFGVTGV